MKIKIEVDAGDRIQFTDDGDIEVDYWSEPLLSVADIRAEAERWQRIVNDRSLATGDDNNLMQEVAESGIVSGSFDFDQAALLIASAWKMAIDFRSDYSDEDHAARQGWERLAVIERERRATLENIVERLNAAGIRTQHGKRWNMGRLIALLTHNNPSKPRQPLPDPAIPGLRQLAGTTQSGRAYTNAARNLGIKRSRLRALWHGREQPTAQELERIQNLTEHGGMGEGEREPSKG